MADSSPRWSPYRRDPQQNATAHHHECPNCLQSTHEAEMFPISFALIVKHTKKENAAQKAALALPSNVDGRSENLASLLTDDPYWATMPPVLKKLGRSLPEIENMKSLLHKTTSLCTVCLDTYNEEIQAQQQRSAKKATARNSSAMHTPHAPKGAPSSVDTTWLGSARQSDRRKDFVFSSLQQQLRAHDNEQDTKHKLRRKLIESSADIDWEALPAVKTAVKKEMRMIAKEQEELQQQSNGALTQLASVSELRPDMSALNLELSMQEDSAANDPLIQAASADEDGVSVFDIPVSHWFMNELWCAVTAVSRHGAIEPEELPRSDPFYAIYHSNRNRYADPPVKRIYTPWINQSELEAGRCPVPPSKVKEFLAKEGGRSGNTATANNNNYGDHAKDASQTQTALPSPRMSEHPQAAAPQAGCGSRKKPKEVPFLDTISTQEKEILAGAIRTVELDEEEMLQFDADDHGSLDTDSRGSNPFGDEDGDDMPSDYDYDL